jgi:UDP-N-acetylmuramate--alanine ligase
VAIGHRAANLGECGVVVMSSAITPDNPEIEAARGARVPVVRRAEMLGELMRLKWAIAVAGTHGKTTTTSLIAALLDAAKLDPTVINGGIINAYGTSATAGRLDGGRGGQIRGTFVRLPASAAVSPASTGAHGVLRPVRRRARRFQTFVENYPFLLAGTQCIDHRGAGAVRPITDRRLISWVQPQADVRALDLSFDRRGVRRRAARPDQRSSPPHRAPAAADAGRHNVPECAAAIAVARSRSTCCRALAPTSAVSSGASRAPDGGGHHGDRRHTYIGRDPRRAR